MAQCWPNGRPPEKRSQIRLLALLSLAAAVHLPCRLTSAFSALATPTSDAVDVDGTRTASFRSRRFQGRRKQERKVPRQRKQRVEIEHVGQYLRGRVLNVGKTASGAAFVDVGRGKPVMLLPEDWDGQVEPDQTVWVWVKQIVWEDGHVLVTMRQPRREVLDLTPGEPLNGTVTVVDQKFGGIFLDVGAKKDGMILPGQLTQEFNASLGDQSIQKGFQMFVWVKDVRDDSTFSLTMFGPEEPRKPMEDIRIGQSLRGRVRKMPSFGGAFVDVGYEKDGWLSDKELSEGPLLGPPEIGQEVDVWVRDFSKERGLQLTLEEPRTAVKDLKVGDKLSGAITGITSFGGIFVDVGAARDGLVNARDAGADAEKLAVGQSIDVWVKQKMGDWNLHLTRLKPKVSRRFRVGERVRGSVTGINKLGGAFIDLGLSSDALVRFEEMTLEAQEGPPVEALPIGHELDLWIKAMHRDGKIDLTMKNPKAQRRQVTRRRGIV